MPDEPGHRVNVGLARTQSFNPTQDPSLLEQREKDPDLFKKKLSKDSQQSLKRFLRDVEEFFEDMAEELLEGEFSDSGRQFFETRRHCQPNIKMTTKGKNDKTILHYILEQMHNAINYKNRPFIHLMRTVPERLREFLECLIISHPDLLISYDSDGRGPLAMAAKNVKPLIFVVLDLVLSDDQLARLSNKTCALKSKVRANETCSIDLPPALEFAFRKEYSSSETCIHGRLDVERLEKWMKNFKEEILPSALGKLVEHKSSILHQLLERGCFSQIDGESKAVAFQHLIKLCPKRHLITADNEGWYPLHKTIQLYKEDKIDFEQLFCVVQTIIRTSPESIYVEGGSGTEAVNPYTLLRKLEPEKDSATSPSSKARLDSWLKAEKLLKLTCIGDTHDRVTKIKYLYGGIKDAKRTFLDLAFKQINKDLVIKLARTVNFQFETILEYVSLRRDENQDSDDHLLAPIASGRPEDRNPYLGVFELLKDGMSDNFIKIEKVEKIFKVVVDDLVPYPHTDRAIVSAVEPFDIEIWDWRKIDISSQVILTAAKGVRELTLHSSGNESVLRSWGSKHGLVQLPKLESITVIMYPELREPRDVCKAYFENFKSAICRRRHGLKNKIFLEFAEGRDSSRDTDEAKAFKDLPGSDQEGWHNALRPYIEFISNPRNDQAQVKIALLDNGVKYKENGIPVTKGISFYGDQSKNVPFRDFFVGPSGHGTKMASLITDVCPVADLYVCRMDDSLQDKFTVDSAIKAVQWAKDMEVDIISMSWTFKTGDGDPGQLKAFQDAIKDADGKNIVCFAALDDKLQNENIENLHPLSSDAVIRIGSATKSGEKAEQGKFRSAYYLFPGQDIPITGGDKKQTASGSSVATALAAGLAGLILYSQRLLLSDNYLTQAQRERLQSWQPKGLINQAFKALAGRPNETMPRDVYVGLGSHFDRDPRILADQSGGQSKVLENLMVSLMLMN